MMLLQCERNKEEPEFDDLLFGIRKLIRRIDELHSDNENDAVYVWILWLKDPNQEVTVIKQLEENLASITDTDEGGQFVIQRLTDGILAVTEEVA